MNKITLIVVIYVLCIQDVLAQENLWYDKTLSSYSEYLVDEFGIRFKSLGEFEDLNQYYILWSAKDKSDKGGVGCIYGPIFLSKKKDCIIMFDAQPNYISNKEKERRGIINSNFHRSQITGEIRNNLGLYFGHGNPLNKNSVETRFNDYVTIIAGKKPREMFNADSIFVYDLPNADSVHFFDESLERMRKEKYPYCTGMFITKNDRATMDIKLFFTKKGEKKKNQYVEMLYKSIWYDDKFHHD